MPRESSADRAPSFRRQRPNARFAGKQFRTILATIALEEVDQHDCTITVPAGDIVRALSGSTPHDPRLVDVLWGDRKLVMLAEDLTFCDEIEPEKAG
jgi:hypothetical protein